MSPRSTCCTTTSLPHLAVVVCLIVIHHLSFKVSASSSTCYGRNGIIVGTPQNTASCTTSNGRRRRSSGMGFWGSSSSNVSTRQATNSRRLHDEAWIPDDDNDDLDDVQIYDIDVPLSSTMTRRNLFRRQPLTTNNFDTTTTAITTSHQHQVQMVSAAAAGGAGAASNTILKNLVRGALLRIASDLSGGTVLESIKTRVTVSQDGPLDACRTIYDQGGIWSFWRGTPSRTVEGAIMGALYLVGSAGTKAAVLKATGSNTLAALAGGCMGGVAQAIIMTPTGLVFTSLNVNKKQPGHENDNAYTVTKRIIQEKGPLGMYIGMKPMVIRQASNWASRAGFTEIARSVLGLSQYGLVGEIGSGIIGGLGSCWNTPIETIRVHMQRDVSMGLPPKTTSQYFNDIKEENGIEGLFRGVTPRAIQAIWQTTFMVVVPNILGV